MPNPRKGESVGAGRCLSRRVLDALDWQPFADDIDRNLDGSTMAKLKGVEHRACTIPSEAIDAPVVDIKWRDNLSPMPEQDVRRVDSDLLERYFGAVAERVRGLG